MGAVSIDIYRKEREYEGLTLADRNVVKYLILYRGRVDVSYNASTNINIEQAGAMFEFNQELIALYASLDTIIKKCNFKEKQSNLLKLIFEGNTIHDICNMDIGYTRSATYELFDRMVGRMVDMNYKIWKEYMKNKGYIKNDG